MLRPKLLIIFIVSSSLLMGAGFLVMSASSKCALPWQNYSCYLRVVDLSLSAGKIDQAIEKIVKLYEIPAFKPYCHDFMHKVGVSAYDLYLSSKIFDFSDTYQYCNYGFFHGFLSKALIASDSFNLHDFCDSISGQRGYMVISSCYHGAGHGLLTIAVSREPNQDIGILIDKASAKCRQGTEGRLLEDCYGGLFMQLGEFIAGIGEYKLHYADPNLYAICGSMKDQLLKKPCYSQLYIFLTHTFGDDLARGAGYISENIREDDYADIALQSFSSLVVDLNHPIRDLETCRALEREVLHLSCLSGFVLKYLALSSVKTDLKAASQFCESNSLTSTEKDYCSQFLNKQIKFLSS